MLVLFLHGPLSVSRRILLMKAIRTYYNGVELGSFVGLFSVFTKALYELLAKRKKKVVILRPTKVRSLLSYFTPKF